ncbi:DUF2218 domain-containing protein [Paenirhodobacter hankyongi]|uniref:DUF2218 domain-containing protein n=1 Tax=Paenirhodobacter hankyongi TaxID=2294033 RepID=A0A421BLQ9_9RHOB|nr:DUF2218 domain-containing protein [Sinirhodobacter hankyongi]RLL63882.1 DUF2218 domain-containing protein [Sinirhodobacter hankyongi]
MLVTTARMTTPHGAKYIAQLCKHFAHKVEAEWTETSGRAALPTGPAEMVADAEGVSFRLVAEDAKAMIQARFVIDSHLVTFAHREAFHGLDWAVEAG